MNPVLAPAARPRFTFSRTAVCRYIEVLGVGLSYADGLAQLQEKSGEARPLEERSIYGQEQWAIDSLGVILVTRPQPEGGLAVVTIHAPPLSGEEIRRAARLTRCDLVARLKRLELALEDARSAQKQRHIAHAERMEAEKKKLRDALRLCLRFVREDPRPGAEALLERVAAVDPGLASDDFIYFEKGRA